LELITANAARLPVLEAVSCTIEVRKAGLPPQRVLGAEPLDPTREMWIFGSKPVFGATLYLRHDEAFAVEGAEVTLTVDLVNPRDKSENSPVKPVKAVAVRLNWEAWDRSGWTVVGVSEAVKAAADPETGFEDHTEAFTKSGEVRFRIPANTAPVNVAGERGYWIRARIVFGDYGREAAYEANAAGHFAATPATFAPPLVRSFQLSFQMQVEAGRPHLVRNHDFQLEDVTDALPFRPFLAIAGAEHAPAMYFGFAPPLAAVPPMEPSIYFHIRGIGSVSAEPGSESLWERRDPISGRWVSLPAHDDTSGLAKSGMLRVVAPFPAITQNLFGSVRVWIRLRMAPNAARNTALLDAVLPNTVMALNVRTTENEIIGSGTGKVSLTFPAARRPVLEGQELQVLENPKPSASERAVILREEGDGAIQPAEPGQGPGVWIRWHEVPDFRASGPLDRHYVVDRQNGVFQFGDGARGKAVPAGTSNVRLRMYRTGGGAAGNRPPNTIINLKTSVPWVDRVVNHLAAAGGSNMETLAGLRDRFPRELRHRKRAVTLEDYEDLARAASRQVHRVKAVPLHDLASDPAGRHREPGTVSLIVLPRSTDPRPVAETELLARVGEYIGERMPAATRLVVVSPEYVRIDLEAQVVASSVAERSQVEAHAADALRRFLHPCTGQQGEGWDFGRLPKHSDVYNILESVPGLEYVAMLRIQTVSERQGAEKQNRFIIYCGEPRVAARAEG
jgi:uncharacterized phage protein gp47/JayE